jgi:hypothetical protein
MTPLPSTASEPQRSRRRRSARRRPSGGMSTSRWRRRAATPASRGQPASTVDSRSSPPRSSRPGGTGLASDEQDDTVRRGRRDRYTSVERRGSRRGCREVGHASPLSSCRCRAALPALGPAEVEDRSAQRATRQGRGRRSSGGRATLGRGRHHGAAVDDEGVAGDPRRRSLARKRAALAMSSGSPRRRSGMPGDASPLLPQRPGHVGLDEARSDGVDADLRAELAGERAVRWMSAALVVL